MRISLIKEAETIKPGMKLYLGNRYDIVSNKPLNMFLDRTGSNKTLEFTVPKDATQEQLNIIKNMIIDRTLSTVKIDGEIRFNKAQVVEEAKSFSYKQIDDMTLSELRYLAQKMGIQTEKNVNRVELKDKLKNATTKDKKSRMK
jgi:murein DD-endopeptidase MepM/ murein hydrolase activator NlpD